MNSSEKKTRKKVDIKKTDEMARKIWLAGLGAYGQGVDSIQSGYGKMNNQSRQMFDELVSRGEKIETNTKGKFQDTGDKIKGQGQKLKDQQVENFEKLNSRLSDIRTKVAVPEFVTEQMEDMRTKMDDLTEAMAKLLSFTNSKDEPKKSAKKKPAAKKAAPKKVAIRKPAAKKAAPSASKSAASTPKATAELAPKAKTEA